MKALKNFIVILTAGLLVVACGDERDTSSRNTSASENVSKERYLEVKGHKTISRLVQTPECDLDKRTVKLSYYETDVETTLKSDDGREQTIPEVVRIFIDSKTGNFKAFSESKVAMVRSTSIKVTNVYDIVDDELKVNGYGRVIINGGELEVDPLNSSKGILVLKQDVTVEAARDISFYKVICEK